jgi:hypothetical protein
VKRKKVEGQRVEVSEETYEVVRDVTLNVVDILQNTLGIKDEGLDRIKNRYTEREV